MKTSVSLIICMCLTVFCSYGNHLDDFPGSKKIKLSCSEHDAEIYVNGKLVGKGALDIKVPDKGCSTVEVKKAGFLTEKMEFCNKKDMPKPPNKYQFSMVKDEAFEVTMASDLANEDVTIKATKGKDDSWKLINQIVLSHFDVIEMNDKETGYIRTAWVVDAFAKSAVRTRLIVKESSSDPLIYKVKLVSEHTDEHVLGATKDIQFREWNRILKKYETLVTEIQARVK
ncbi:hypothetical protein [Formosa haliotis]|uniref:hypothetical protein n=1 Tax=Formosa haliotis TaxID=1555194 RepID=UPI000824F81A|nr:hypothetical protein [Formosa haliotis]